MSKTLLIIRPQARQAADSALCAQWGWQGVPCVPLAIAAQTDKLHRLPEKMITADAVFWVSPTAVDIGATAFSGSLKAISVPHVAVGQATAARLQNLGAQQIVCAKQGNDSEAALALPVWHRLPERARVLIVRGAGGRDFLAQQLSARGLMVDWAEIYRRMPQAVDWAAVETAKPCAAWITSAQLAQEFWAQIPPKLAQSVHSLLYFAHHERVCSTLRDLGAKNVYLVNDLAHMLHVLSCLPSRISND